ncbi:MAG: hypothetical protein IJ124_04380, partial [Clostridia bacterium]|nr:hypothetical protein [Clostridia bacterium]
MDAPAKAPGGVQFSLVHAKFKNRFQSRKSIICYQIVIRAKEKSRKPLPLRGFRDLGDHSHSLPSASSLTNPLRRLGSWYLYDSYYTQIIGYRDFCCHCVVTVKAEPYDKYRASAIHYGSLYTHSAEPSSLSLPVFNPVPDDHFQILLLGFVTDVRKHSIIGYQSCTHVVAVLLEELAINREAVFVGELTAEMNSRSRIALAEGMNLPKRGEVMGEVFGQLIEIILPPRTP